MASSTTPSTPARSTTSGCPTSPAGSCSSPSPPPQRWGCSSRSPCSSSTASSAARTSTRSFPPRCTTASGCCPGPRWPAASSPASTSRTSKPPSGARMGSDNPFYNRTLRLLADKQRNWDTLDAVRDIAGSIGATPSQVALSWLTNRPSVTAPIIAASNLDAARGEPGRRRPRARRGRHQAPRRRQRPHPRRLPLRPLRREAARPLRRLQRPGHPRAHVAARQERARPFNFAAQQAVPQGVPLRHFDAMRLRSSLCLERTDMAVGQGQSCPYGLAGLLLGRFRVPRVLNAPPSAPVGPQGRTERCVASGARRQARKGWTGRSGWMLSTNVMVTA